MGSRIGKWILSWLFMLLLPGFGRAANTALQPVCALLDMREVVGKSALLDLLDAKLPQDLPARFVERQQIQKLIAEQQTQALGGADAGKQRVAIGKFLQADVLIILLNVDKALPRLEMVICETRHGMRISVDDFTPGNDPAADVAAMEGLIGRSLKKQGERTTAICAVPPFVSNDLTNEFSYLQRAYAALIEQSLMQRPGVLVVEFPEAQAIAREITLSNGADVSRPMPIYLLGDFRNEGVNGRKDEAVGEKRTIDVHLTVKKADQVLGERRQAGMAPAAVAAFLRESADELLIKATNVPEQHSSPEAELTQLAQRTGELEKLSSWSQASDLIEVSLLLKPDQPQLERDAVVALTHVAAGEVTPYAKKDERRSGLRQIARAYEHLERYLHTNAALTDPNPADLVYSLMHALRAAPEPSPPGPLYYRPPTPEALYFQTCQANNRIILDFLTRACAAGNDSFGRLLGAVNYDPFKSVCQPLQEVLQTTRDVPRAKERAIALTVQATLGGGNVLESPPGQAYLNWLTSSPVEGYRQAGELLRRDPRGGIPPEPIAPLVPARGLDPTRPSGVKLAPVVLSVHDADGKPIIPFPADRALVPAGAGRDVGFGQYGVYVFKNKGESKVVYRQSVPIQIDGAVFDGTYVWARMWAQKSTVLLIDPVKEKVWCITEGIPPVTDLMMIAPLGPGRVCMVGAADRTWVALADVHPDGPEHGYNVNVILEAKEQPDNSPEQWKSTTVAFRPSYIYALTDQHGDKSSAARVLIGRWYRGRSRLDRPLMVDPQRKTVEVLDEGLTSGGAVINGALYWTDSSPETPYLWRFAVPTLRKEKVRDDLTDGRLLLAEGHVFLIETDNLRAFMAKKEKRNAYWPKQWWVADAIDQPFRPLWPAVPDEEPMRAISVTYSETFGLIGWAVTEQGHNKTYLVSLIDPGKSARAQPTSRP